ncbi:MAG: hypothetical protein WBV36_04380 [Terriglobales bacterium]
MKRLRFSSLAYLRRLLAQMKLLFRRKREPEDPFAYSMATVRRPPHGRGGAAVADVEMDDLESK